MSRVSALKCEKEGFRSSDLVRKPHPLEGDHFDGPGPNPKS